MSAYYCTNVERLTKARLDKEKTELTNEKEHAHCLFFFFVDKIRKKIAENLANYK